MDRPALKALVLPFDRQDRSLPDAEAPWAFFNAHILPNERQWKAGFACQQSFRPLYVDLENAGFDTAPILARVSAQQLYSGALVLTDRTKAVNERNLIHAIAAVDEGAPIIVCGEKTTGIGPLKKWAARFGEPADTFSKFHAQCFTLIASASAKKAASLIQTSDDAGLFAKGKIDKGSALLATTFDTSIKGNVADFCSGTGYLAQELAARSAPTSLTLLEAEYHAVEASKKLDTSGIPTSFHWLDLTRETPPSNYDAIVMNPPFHTMRAAEPALGQTLIQAARKALRPRGILRLVANRTLPYEKTLQANFGSFREIIAQDGFKVLEARAKA